MLTDLRARHDAGETNSKLMCIDGNSVTIENMEVRAIWDPCEVKIQTYKTAIESAQLVCFLELMILFQVSRRREDTQVDVKPRILKMTPLVMLGRINF